MPDRVDPDVKAVQPPGAHAVVDGTPAEAERDELRSGDDPVLPVRQSGDRPLTCAS
jgi:hypothetical protein